MRNFNCPTIAFKSTSCALEAINTDDSDTFEFYRRLPLVYKQCCFRDALSPRFAAFLRDFASLQWLHRFYY